MTDLSDLPAVASPGMAVVAFLTGVLAFIAPGLVAWCARGLRWLAHPDARHRSHS